MGLGCRVFTKRLRTNGHAAAGPARRAASGPDRRGMPLPAVNVILALEA